jgi:hypothetical protein
MEARATGVPQQPPVRRPRYEITVWVVRPEIVRNPTAAEYRKDFYGKFLFNGIDAGAGITTDEALLAGLKKANPKFTFPAVEVRRSRTMPGDMPWAVTGLPNGHQLTLSVIERDRDKVIRDMTRPDRVSDPKRVRAKLEKEILLNEEGRTEAEPNGESASSPGTGSGKTASRYRGHHSVMPGAIVLLDANAQFADTETAPRYRPAYLILYRVQPLK